MLAFPSPDNASEVFDLVDALETAEGKGVDVRLRISSCADAGSSVCRSTEADASDGTDSYLNLTASATTADISRAYRRRSLELQCVMPRAIAADHCSPDKNPNVPLIHERFARLGVIANLLRDDEQRKRCARCILNRPDASDDHWRKVGVPKWRGTGCASAPAWSPLTSQTITRAIGLDCRSCWPASRWRPACFNTPRNGSVGSATSVASTSARQSARVEAETRSLRDRARTAAYGSGEAAASATERKRVRIPMRAGDDDAPRKNRPMLTVIVEGPQMTAVYDDGAEVPLDSTSVPKPQLLATWVPALLRAIAARAVSRKLPAAPAAIEDLAPPYELAPPPRTASPAGGVQRRKGQPRRK